MDTSTGEPAPAPVKRRRRFWVLVRRGLIGVIGFFFLIMLLIHLPPVQQVVIRKVQKSISETLQTRVEIGSFTLHPISDLTLHDIFIGSPDRPEDTLISARHLEVDYRRIWDVLNRRLLITQLGIEEGVLHIHRIPGDSLNNLDVALGRLLPPADPTKPGFVLDLSSMRANALTVRINDEPAGTWMQFDLPRADVIFHEMDISGKFLHIDELDLERPDIRVLIRPPLNLPLPSTDTAYVASAEPWKFDIGRWRLKGGSFSLDDPARPVQTYPLSNSLDFAHLALEEVDIRVDSLSIRGWNFEGVNAFVSLRDRKGFVLDELSADRGRVASDGLFLDDLVIRTPGTEIRNSVVMDYDAYSDFGRFSRLVHMELPEADIQLLLSDLLVIAPALQDVEFLSHNQDKVLSLRGDVTGILNELRIDRMRAGLGGIALQGDLRSKDLTIPDRQLIRLDLEDSYLQAGDLRDILPGVQLPDFVDRLDRVRFSGIFDGNPADFLATGTFITAHGEITLDMNMSKLNAMAAGDFAGQVGLRDFDLGELLGDQSLGRVTMTGRVIEGRGIGRSDMYMDLTGQLASLEFNGYTYQQARVDGQITGRSFFGTVDVNDPNLELHFEGRADMSGSRPVLDFISRVERVRFWELGFTRSPMELHGIFEVNGTAGRLDQLQGSLWGEQIRLTKGDQVFLLDTLNITGEVDTLSGIRSYGIYSDILEGQVAGHFDPGQLINRVHDYLHRYYPSAIDAPKTALPAGETVTDSLGWSLRIPDSEEWLTLAGLQDANIRQVSTTGTLDLGRERITGSIELPIVHVKGINIYATDIRFDETAGSLQADLEVVAADLRENFFFEEVFLSGLITDKKINLNVRTDHLADIVDKLDLDIVAQPEAGAWNLEINPRNLVMLGQPWEVPAGNLINISKQSFSLENFELVSPHQRISVDDIDNKGIVAFVSGFDISYLNELWINDKFQFSGEYSMDLEIDNLFDIGQLECVLQVPALRINNEAYGHWRVAAHMQDPKDSVRIDIAMRNGETELIGDGAFLPPIKAVPKHQQNYLRMDLTAVEFPLDFLEFLIGSNIRDTEGSIDMTLGLRGKTHQLNPSGSGRVYNGSTTIDYLGAGYSFHDQAFRITETAIDLSGIVLYDVLGNTATVQGGLTHRYLRDLGLNATITSDRFLGLDVTSEENNLFYGRGIGQMYARFTGTVANPYMYIQTTTAKGTHISIPLSGAASNTDQDFVVFLENGLLPATAVTQIDLGGINLTMNMTITEDAIVEIIFDENTGEVLRGVGNGNLQLAMNRSGNFTMYGNYVIERGDYLFTNFRIVRKPFELLQGGQIVWEGDPYNATINIQAKYKGLEASVATLIQEYLSSNPDPELSDQARERTEVDLTMALRGSLLQPNITFDISFPNIAPQLRAYTDAKVAALRANENAMFEQVVGLLISRSFWPSNASSGSGLLSRGIDNTLSELISATLSSYLGGLLGDIIPEGKVLTGIDFIVGLDLPFTSGNIVSDDGQLQDLGATEVEISLPLEFFNDRLAVNVGGNYVTGASLVNADRYWAGDVTFEYRLTPDGRFRVRAYNRNTLTVEGRKNKIGVGIAYRREYDSLSDVFRRKKKTKETADSIRIIPVEDPEIQ